MENRPKGSFISAQAPIGKVVRRFTGAVMLKRHPSPVSGGSLRLHFGRYGWVMKPVLSVRQAIFLHHYPAMPLPRLQADFFARIADPQGVRAIFEHMPGVFFFMKDDQGRHIAANSATFERFGIKSERELVGAMDEKFFPPDVAKAYRDDDQKVIRSGKPLINRLEVWYDEQRNLSWFLCTKLPVRDKRGKVIGVMGITRRDEDRMRQHDVREVTVAVQYAREHCHEVVTTAELARAASVSERHLHRKLRIALDISPYELLLRSRIQSAAEALAKTTLPIIQIALDHAFCDQSAFTQQFRKRTGMTPKEFRRRHQG